MGDSNDMNTKSQYIYDMLVYKPETLTKHKAIMQPRTSNSTLTSTTTIDNVLISSTKDFDSREVMASGNDAGSLCCKDFNIRLDQTGKEDKVTFHQQSQIC